MIKDSDTNHILRIIQGENPGLIITLNNGINTIGRRDADIIIKDSAVSSKHARIEISSGKVIIKDTDSLNGVFINDRKTVNSVLVPGDRIKISNTVFEYILYEKECDKTIVLKYTKKENNQHADHNISDDWYINRGKERYGPYSWENIKQYAKEGRVLLDDQLSNEKKNIRLQACSFSELAKIFKYNKKHKTENISCAPKKNKLIYIALSAFAVLAVFSLIVLFFLYRIFFPEERIWPNTIYIEEPISVLSHDQHLIIGNLDNHNISINIPAGAFREPTEIRLSSPSEQITYSSGSITPAGPLYKFEIDGPDPFSIKPIQMKFRLHSEVLNRLKDIGALRVAHYQKDYGWTYYEPKEINREEKYLTFETYHNWFWSTAELSEEERVEEYIEKRSRRDWALLQVEGEVEEAVTRMVESLLIDGFDADNPDVIRQMTTDLTKLVIEEIKYTHGGDDGTKKDEHKIGQIGVDLYEGDYGKVAVEVGKSIAIGLARIFGGELVNKAVKITGTAASVIGALTEGDVQGAVNYISDHIVNDYTTIKALAIPVRGIRQTIDNWGNTTVEEAYQIYSKGGLSRFAIYDKGNFDDVWDSFPGLQSTVIGNLEKAYREEQGLWWFQSIPETEQKRMQDRAKERLKNQFENRMHQESDQYLAKAREDNRLILEALKERRLFYDWKWWFPNAETMENALDGFYEEMRMVLRDTDRSMIISDQDLIIEDSRFGDGWDYRQFDRDKEIRLKDVVDLVIIRQTEGEEAYADELIRRGLINDIVPQVAIEGDRRIIYRLEPGETEITHHFSASAIPPDTYQYVWCSGDGGERTVTRGPGESSNATYTYRNITEPVTYFPSVSLLDKDGKILSSHSISIRVETATPMAGLVLEPDWQSVEKGKRFNIKAHISNLPFRYSDDPSLSGPVSVVDLAIDYGDGHTRNIDGINAVDGEANVDITHIYNQKFDSDSKEYTIMVHLTGPDIFLASRIATVRVTKSESEAEKVMVPNVIGMSQSYAKQSIVQIGLICLITPANHDTVPKGQVISQEPSARKIVEKGSSVAIKVSSGPLSDPGRLGAVSGSFSGNHPSGNISYSLSGVLAYPSTDHIPEWVHGSGSYSRSRYGSANRSYRGYIVGDTITLTVSYSGAFCHDLSFSSGSDNSEFWNCGDPSVTLSFPAPPEGESVSFSVTNRGRNPGGSTRVSVGGTFIHKPSESN